LWNLYLVQLHFTIKRRKSLRKLFEKCLNNLLIEYGETEENLDYYDCIIDFMCEQKIDVRDFKRFINSVISLVFNGSSYLNKRDMMIIEYIRLYNLPLYQEIYQNRVYFISHDKRKDIETYAMSFRKKEFNSKAKNFLMNYF
ncbi:MAG: P-loop NTPase fold protein, partial [Bacillota bacterium]